MDSVATPAGGGVEKNGATDNAREPVSGAETGVAVPPPAQPPARLTKRIKPNARELRMASFLRRRRACSASNWITAAIIPSRAGRGHAHLYGLSAHFAVTGGDERCTPAKSSERSPALGLACLGGPQPPRASAACGRRRNRMLTNARMIRSRVLGMPTP